MWRCSITFKTHHSDYLWLLTLAVAPTKQALSWALPVTPLDNSSACLGPTFNLEDDSNNDGLMCFAGHVLADGSRLESNACACNARNYLQDLNPAWSGQMHRGPKIPINILISCSAGQRAVTSMCLMKSLEWRNSARRNCKSFDGQFNTSISIGSAFLGRLCNLVAHCVFLRVGGLATASNSEHMCGGIPESGLEIRFGELAATERNHASR